MGKKELNPADVYRKQQRKKELKKCKETRNVVRSVQELLSDPNKIEEEIQKAQKASDASALDKGLKDRIKELKMMKTVAVTKQKIDMASGKTDRDAAAAVREAEMLERDRQRDRRRGLRPEDSQISTRADDGDPLESYRSKDQESSSSSSRPIAAPALIEQSGFIQQQSQQHILVQPQIFQPQTVLPQQVAPTLFGIAPILSFPSDSVPPPPPLFRPPPPMPPGLQLRVPPPIFTPPALEGASTSSTSVLSQTVPPPPPPPPIFPKPSPDNFDQSEEPLDSSAASADSDTEEDLGPRRFHAVDSSEEKEQQIEVPVTAFPFSFSSADFKMPSAEELMRRRHAVSEETEILTVENSAAKYDVSYPKPESIRAEQEKEQEQDSESKFAATEETIRAEKSENIFFPKTRTIYIPPSVPVLGTVPLKAMSGGLGGLADYGSDSDDDDDDDDVGEKNVSVITDVPRFVPMALPSEFRSYESVASAPVRTSHREDHSEEPSPPVAASKEHSVPTGSSNSHSHGVADDVTAFLDSIATNSLSLSTVPPPKQTPDRNQNQNPPRPSPIVGMKVQVPPTKAPLKSIRPDFALTAFIPNALRMKRPAQPMGKIAAKVPKIESNVPISGSSNSSSSIGGDVKRTELVGGVDDAYLTFLDEIGELTG